MTFSQVVLPLHKCNSDIEKVREIKWKDWHMDVQVSTERTLVDAWISNMEDQDLRKLVIEIFGL